MIVALHVATGAAAGAASGSRLAALLLGPVLHLAGDRVPHQDIRSRRFEIGSGLACLLLLAARPGTTTSSASILCEAGTRLSRGRRAKRNTHALRASGAADAQHRRRKERRPARHPAALEREATLTTSIPGVLTTGDVDLQVRTDQDSFEEARDVLSELYEPLHPEAWHSEGAFFVASDSQPQVEERHSRRRVHTLANTTGGRRVTR